MEECCKTSPKVTGQRSLTFGRQGPHFPGTTGGHTLPVPMTQASPLQQPRVPQSPSQMQQPQHSPSNVQHHPVANYSFAPLNPFLQQRHSPQTALNIERERERERDRERERENEERMRRNEMLQREYEREQMELREQAQRDRHSPHENHTSTIPLQQPVPSRGQGTLHGPNGILSHMDIGVGPNSSGVSVASNGPAGVFGGSLQNVVNQSSPRPFIQQSSHVIPHQQLLGGFGNAMTPQQLPNGMAALSQGQQPILNVSSRPISDSCVLFWPL